MTIYVDDAELEVRGIGLPLSHMTGTTLPELREFAEAMGVRGLRDQTHDPNHVHFEVTTFRRWLAIRHGAVRVPRNAYPYLYRLLPISGDRGRMWRAQPGPLQLFSSEQLADWALDRSILLPPPRTWLFQQG